MSCALLPTSNQDTHACAEIFCVYKGFVDKMVVFWGTTKEKRIWDKESLGE